MCKENHLKLVRKLLLPLPVCLALLGMGLESQAAVPPPPNDDLTNAQAVAGLSGTVTGSNIGATAEPNEPPSYTNGTVAPPIGNPAGATIWCSWTAPANGIVSFDTRGSTLPNGSTMDTVMSVYTVPLSEDVLTTNGTYIVETNLTLSMTNLVLVTNNDDDPNTNAWPLTSRVSFPATAGTTYYIQLDGSDKDYGTNEEGYIELNWGPSLAGGTLSFTTSLYEVGILDDVDYDAGNEEASFESPYYYQGAGVYAAAHPVFGGAPVSTNNIALDEADGFEVPEGRVTVTRTGAFSGRILVDLIVTNGYLENTYSSNIWVTNLTVSDVQYDTNSGLPILTNVDSFTITTNAAAEMVLEYYTSTGLLSDFIYDDYVTVTESWDKTTLLTNIVGETNCGVFPVAVAIDQTNVVSKTNFNASSNIVSITNTTMELYYIDIYTNVLTPSAIAGVDYSTNDNQTLEFDDYQMSQDAFIGIGWEYTGLGIGGPDWPDVFGNDIYGGLNRMVLLTLANPRLATNESLDVEPPTIAPVDTNLVGVGVFTPGSQAQLLIEDYYNLPTPDPCYSPTNTSKTNIYTMYNFLRRNFACDRDYYGSIVVWVYREGDDTADNASVDFYIDDVDKSIFDSDFVTQAGSDYALGVSQGSTGTPAGNWDFELPYAGNGPDTIKFGKGVDAIAVTIPLNDNGAVEFNQDFQIALTNPQKDAGLDYIGNLGIANVTILYNDKVPGGEQPGGAVDRTWNVDNHYYSIPPYNDFPGADLEVDAIALQPNGMAVIGGQFHAFDDASLYHVARIQTDGFPDPAFNPGSGGNDSVLAVAVDAANGILVGGNFTAFNNERGTVHIARLNADGSVDTNFAAATGAGANGAIRAITLDNNGNILIGGDFTTFNNMSVSNIARLQPTGALDTNFNAGVMDPNGTVYAVAVDSRNNVLIGGSFGSVDGTNWPGLARLLPSGALDPTFNPGVDVPNGGIVYSVAVEAPGNQIVIGGDFSQVGDATLNNIARLNSDGSVDASFNAGAGANDTVWSVAIQTNGRVLLAGQFTQVGPVRRLGMARLLTNGWVDTSFMDTSYNQFAGLPNHYYNPQAVDPSDYPATNNTLNFIKAMALEPSGNLIVGGSFSRVGGGFTRDDTRPRGNVAQIIGAPTPGPQTDGGGNGNYPGNISFTQTQYSVDDTANKLFITVNRTNGSLGPFNVVMATNNLPGLGSQAATYKDYGLVDNGLALYPSGGWIGTPVPYGWRVSDGMYGFNYSTTPYGEVATLEVNIYNDPRAGQNLFADLSLLAVNTDNTFLLGGENIPTQPAIGQGSATLEIINNNFPAGTLGFSATNYSVVQSGRALTITVLRTNGSYGNVSVAFKTANGFTNGPPGVVSAIGGIDYISTNGVLNFANDVVSQTFSVKIIDFATLQSNKFFNVVLSNPGNGASFDTNNPPVLVTNSVVTIVDDHFLPGHLAFGASTFTGTKGGVSTIPVTRTGGALGTISVTVVSSNLTASNGVNYLPVSNVLTWGNAIITPQTITVTNLEDGIVEGTKTMMLSLVNPVVTGSPAEDSLVLEYPTHATNSILDDDFYGAPAFVQPNFNVLQNGGMVMITAVRVGGAVGTVSVQYATANGTNAVGALNAHAGTNYGAVSGTLTFGPGVTSQSFSIPIYYTPSETNAANRTINLSLFNASPAAITNGFPKSATVTILDNQLVTGNPGSVDTTIQTGTGFNGAVGSLCMQPDGKVLAAGSFTSVDNIPLNNVARLNANGSVDSGFVSGQAGADGTIRAVLSQTPNAGQTNGSIMVVGDFVNFDSVGRPGIARVNLDGSLDESFNPGSGTDSGVYAIVQMPTNQFPTPTYVIGGNFANYNNAPLSGVARINNVGQADPTFNPGAGVTSTNGTVHALAVQANGQLIVGGDFTIFNNAPHHHLVRLNLDGSVDATFNPDTGASVSGSVQAVLVQPDGRILIGGVFTSVNGVSLNHLARLNQDGTLDTAFNVGQGANNSVLALALDSQQRILVAGQFSQCSGVTRNGLTRLNPDGTVDPDINFGAGANGYVGAIAIQGNDEINIGGLFTSFGGVAQNNFTRLYGLAISGAGVLNFSQPVFGALQSQSNAVVTVQRFGGTGTTNIPVVSAVVSTSNGTGLAGVDYLSVVSTVNFPLGETFASVAIPVLDTGTVGPDKTVNLSLSNPIAASLGGESSAELVITNVNAGVAFSAPSYRVEENILGGKVYIPVVRVGSMVGTMTVAVYTGTNGTAIPNVDYTPETNVLTFPPGLTTNLLVIPILNDTNMFQDTTVDLELAAATGGFLITPSEATLTIATVYAGPGIIAFGQTNYVVSEASTNAVITLIRTNGLTGPVSVTFSTSNGTAVAGVNYEPVNQVVSFSDSQSYQTVNIPILSNTVATPDTTVNLILSNPVNTLIGGTNVETLTIQNTIQSFTFGLPGSSPDYFIGEGSGSLTLAIYRNGPTNGTVSVNYATYSPANASLTNGLAVPGTNYVPTSGTLTYGPGQTIQTIPVVIIQGTTVDGPLSFQVILSNPSTGTQVGSPGVAEVTILGDVTGFSMATNAYSVGENGSNLVVTINRMNVDTGAVTVEYATSDSNAVAGVDYTATSGVLLFESGQATNNVTIPILNPNIVEGGKVFNFTLSNPSANCYLLSPTNAAITITNVLTGISFSGSAYGVGDKQSPAQISVARTGVTNNTVSVSYATAAGTAVPGKNYEDTGGTLTFAPGVTNLYFPITIIDDHLITPNFTVNLSLFNAEGAILNQPSNAVLTIANQDGAFIGPAGTLLLYESDKPTNGIVDPGETVTVEFGMECISGGSTTNLIAVMQTNANVTPLITSTNGPTNYYGVLLQGGHSVSRPFTFTANGVNNQVIDVYFQMYDGTNALTNVVFSFALGSTVTTFANSGVILVTNQLSFGSPPAPGYPYPSTINVIGINGTIDRLTATISNLNHSDPGDIEIVLVSPAELTSPSQNILLMADTGGGVAVTNLTQNFDDYASTFMLATNLPDNTTATNKPTAYVTVNNFGVNTTTLIGNQWPYLPAMPSPVPAPVAPNYYSTNLGVLDGTTANGVWSLYVADTSSPDSGAISNGWALNISTGNPVLPGVDLELGVTVAPSVATVSNQLIYTVTLTNYGPAVAGGVVITNSFPSGLTYLSNNFAGWVTNFGPVMTFTSTNTLAVSNGLAFNLYMEPGASGSLTNDFAAAANQMDATTNNVTNVVTVVGSQSADLGVIITASENELTAGNLVTLYVVITNTGPSAAVSAVVSNVLPSGLLFISDTTSSTNGVVSNSGGASVWNLGGLGATSNATLMIVAQATATNGATVLDTAGVASAIYDPYKFNNYNSYKIVVDPAPVMSISNAAHAFTLTWAGGATNFELQGATNLQRPIVWTTLTNVVLTNSEGLYSITLPTNGGYDFFRLRTKVP